jgi:hypothetical protein
MAGIGHIGTWRPGGAWRTEGGAGMVGSYLIPIIVPIVAFAAMAAWLGMVFWADAHPQWKAHAAATGPKITAAGTPSAAAGPGARQGSEITAPAGDRKAA